MDFSDVDSASSDVGSEVSEVETADTDFGDGDGVNDFDETYNEMNSGDEALEYSGESDGMGSSDFDENKSDDTTDEMVDNELSDFDDTNMTDEVSEPQENINSDETANQSDMTTDESVDAALSDFDDDLDVTEENSLGEDDVTETDDNSDAESDSANAETNEDVEPVGSSYEVNDNDVSNGEEADIGSESVEDEASETGEEANETEETTDDVEEIYADSAEDAVSDDTAEGEDTVADDGAVEDVDASSEEEVSENSGDTSNDGSETMSDESQYNATEVEAAENNDVQNENVINSSPEVENPSQIDNESEAQENVDKGDNSEKTAIFENVSYHQGQNDMGALGTCGPTSIANSLNRVTGTSDYSENAVLHNAMDNNLCHNSDNPYSCGGTTTKDVVNIIDNVKDPESNIHSEVYEYGNALDVDALADRLDDSGTVAMVGVDSAALWDQRGDVSNSGLFQGASEAPSDHWITVDSPVRDENGNVTGFNIIDSGGGVDFVDRDKFERMYQGDDNHRVSDPTAILVSNRGDAVNTYSQPEGVERASYYKGSGSELPSDGGDPPHELRDVKIQNTERTSSGEELSPKQQEINNAFRGDNFDAGNSFEGKVPENRRDELIDANSKTTCGFKENLDGSCDDMKYGTSFSPEQKEKLSELRDLRDNVPEIKEDTIMQKVITPDQMKQYLEDGKTNVTGCASRAEDVVPYTNNLEQAYETLRLDYHGDGSYYDGNDFNSAIQNGEDMYIMRFTTDYSPSNDTYPKINEFTKPPCTGTGYTGSEEHLVPEFTYSMDENGEYNGAGQEITNGAIYKVDKEGKETMVGYWNSNLGRFSEVK